MMLTRGPDPQVQKRSGDREGSAGRQRRVATTTQLEVRIGDIDDASRPRVAAGEPMRCESKTAVNPGGRCAGRRDTRRRVAEWSRDY